jgi:hypothetical protein
MSFAGGRAIRDTVERVVELITTMRTWPDATGQEREPFREADYRYDLPEAGPSDSRTFQVLPLALGKFRGGTQMAGATNDRDFVLAVKVCYLVGGGESADLKQTRIAALQDAEAISQTLRNPLNRNGRENAPVWVQMTDDDVATLTQTEDRLICEMRFRAWLQITQEATVAA